VEELEERKTIGERLLERMARRERPAPRLTASHRTFDDRYARFARTQADSRLGALMFPDSIHPEFEESGSDPLNGDWSYLSSSPYWNRLRRLGNARLRRQQRLAGLQDRMSRRTRLSAIRRLPEARSVGLPFLGLPSLMANDFEVLAHAPTEVPQEASDVSGIQESRPGSTFQGARTSASPWLSGTFTGARVAAKREKSRPLDRIAERAPAPARSIERVRAAVAYRSAERDASGSNDKTLSRRPTASTVRRVPADDTRRYSDVEPVDVQAEDRRDVRRARNVLRRRANPVRAVDLAYEAALPDDFLPPSRHAEGRIAPRSARRQTRRGLRPVMSQSPLMAALEPVQHAEVVNQPLPARRPLAATGGTIARRTVHRQVESSKRMLSASPVRRPAMVAPSAVTLSRGEVSDVSNISHMEANVSRAETNVSRGEASVANRHEGSVAGPHTEHAEARIDRGSRSAPMVRALERSESVPESVFERPLTERRPVANRPVQTREGLFAPERSVLIPGVDAQTVTDEAVPVEAERRATRNNVAVRATERLSVGLPAQPEPQIGAPPVAVRPHRAVRTASQVYAPAASLLETAEPGQVVASSVSERPIERATERMVTQASVQDGGEGPRPSERAGERMASLDDTSVRVRRAYVPSSALEPTTVEHHLAGPESEELAQGAHAAERATRDPLVGYTAAKVARTPKSDHTSSEIHKTSPSRWAPRRFKSPTRHARPIRSRGIRFSGDSASITLAPQEMPRDGVNRGTGRTPAVDIRQVQEAWERTGRPIDWTAARIEVIQVPILTEAIRPQAQTVRTETGAYVAARSAREEGTGSARNQRGMTRGPATVAAEGVVPIPGVASPADAVQAQNIEMDALAPVGTASTPRRTGFDHTVNGVEQGVVHNEMPVWAQRSTGRPLIRDAKDLVSELAKASAPEQIVQLLMSDGDSVRRATSSLPQPVIQVIQQIKTEAARSEHEIQEQFVTEAETETVRRRGARRGGVRSSARVVRGMTGLKPGGSSRAANGSLDKVSKLAKRLQDLISMAENQNRGGARQEIRMAEDSSAAKAEGAASPTQAEDGRNVSADIDNLAREVTEHVTRELELRRERRQEDPDGRNIWW